MTGITVGIGLPTLGVGDPAGLTGVAAAARHAEALGIEAVSVGDLIMGDGTPALEAVVALSAAAAATERIGLEFGVISLPLRPVAWVAAQIQALQHLSGGRVVLGVGSGGPPFWRAVGVAGRQRGRRTDAALAVLARLIAGEPVRVPDQPGQPEVTLAPAAPVPPILVGGNSAAAIRRAAEFADGWFPSQIAPGTLAAGVARLCDQAAARGRPPPLVHVGGLVIAPDDESARAERAERASFVRGMPASMGSRRTSRRPRSLPGRRRPPDIWPRTPRRAPTRSSSQLTRAWRVMAGCGSPNMSSRPAPCWTEQR